MTSSFQAASLVASPSYPNAVAWSDENLVAVASGHLVTILNPAMPFGPRGLITIPPSKPFPIGVVEREDLLSGCLLSACLSRDLRPCVRSISWSPVGFAPHAGSLLAVCTIEGHVKLYRMPYCEFSAEWIEVFDISDMMYKYFSSIEFGESDTHNAEHSSEQANQLSLEHGCTAKQSSSVSKMERKRRRENSLALINKDTVNSRSCKDSYPSSIPCPGKLITASKEVALFPCSLLQEGSPVEVLRLDGQQCIWIAGTLKCFSGGKALVLFPEVNRQEKPSEWVEMQPHHYNSDGRNLLTDTVANQENGIPSIRPSINVGRLPKQIPLRDCHGVEEILKIGDMVETWTNDRWIEGTFMGFNDSGLLVKLHGDMGSVSLDASFVRLAPVWINEQNSWKVTIVRIEIKDQELHKVVGVKSHNMEANNPNQVVPVCHSKAKPRKKIPEVSGLPLISADQYASRSTMLSSLIVAWSPVVQLVSELGPVDMNDSATCCSILAVGGKSGKISFWKVPEPQCFSVMSHGDSTSAFLVGLLQAHSGWITAIGWALCSSGASDPLLLLATGSSDGSVKIWLGNSGQLLKSSEVNHAPFSLLKEVETPDSVAISVVSLIVPIKSPDKLHLAVGKGSGTLDVFICDIATTSGKVDKVVSDGAHNHVDNSIRSWILRDNFLFEVPISPNTPAVKSSSDVCNVFDSCFGLAASPGNLMVAVVRSFDVDFLNPMYQARAQKAAVEFFWIGGQQLDRLPNEDSNFDVEKFSGFSEKELIYWTHNILWSLNQYEQVDKPLVIWDIITALLAFKQSTPEYVDHVLAKWLIPWVGTQLGPSVAKTLSHAPRFLSNMSVRQLHLMNILSRRVVLAELTAEKISYNEKNLEELSDAKEEYITSWLDLLQNSEREIRERLVAFSFSTVSSLISNSSTKFSPRCWHPVGLAQMEQWIALDRNHIQDHLKLLAGEVRKFKKSKIQSICNYVEEEQCSYCSAPVPFESTEVAFCQGADCGDGVCRSHKLFRCAASMQVCPTTPSWFCLCCQRWTSNLAPLALFRMVTYPSDSRFSTQYFKLDLLSKPLCPFCGVLLQRLQPEFILSTSPV